MSRVLIIEDNRGIAEGIAANLEVEGYAVSIAGNGRGGLDAARREPADLVILDLMLPDIEGLQVLRTLRDEGFEAPVLILSARGEEPDKVRGFRVGADDYVVKPFGLQELLARVEALCRRAARREGRAAQIRLGDASLDVAARRLTRRGKEIALRPREMDLLLALVSRRGQVVSRETLLASVWRYAPGIVTRTVDAHVAELRRALEPDLDQPRYLVTIRKSGYRLDIDE